MLAKEKIEKHYSDVRNAVSDSLENSFAEKFGEGEESAFADGVRKELERLNESFKAEIDSLEKSSEWDKFCISFFGETNAGKSTIIESLRIIYNEETRLEKIISGKNQAAEKIASNNEEYEKLIKATSELKEFAKKGGKRRFTAKAIAISCVISALVSASALLAVAYFI